MSPAGTVENRSGALSPALAAKGTRKSRTKGRILERKFISRPPNDLAAVKARHVAPGIGIDKTVRVDVDGGTHRALDPRSPGIPDDVQRRRGETAQVTVVKIRRKNGQGGRRSGAVQCVLFPAGLDPLI